MPVEAKVYRILIASPRDVEEEEKIIREQSYKWNAANTMGMKKILMPIRWNTDATPSLEGRGQSVINSQLVDSCDLLIGIFRTRLGTPTPEADSGTVEEIERANNQGKPCLVYFHDPVTEVGIDKEQYQKLQIYKKELQTKGLTDNYNSLDEFRDKVYGHISSVVHKLSQEDKERRAAEQEAKLTEQAIGLPVQTIPTTFNTEISFKTLSEAQTSVKTLLDSRFGVQDMEDAKEQEIARIQSVLTSPELAELFSRQPSVETIPAIAQILEAATTPSMYALAAIGRYADETSPEWLDIVGDWIERLSTRKIEGYYKWPIYIKTYPGLLLLYTLGISALRAGKINFLKEVTSRQVYSDEYNSDTFLLNAIDPGYVFYQNISQMIEPGFERRFSPVSDHLYPLLKSKLYAKEQESRYRDWFDFFEFLLSFKAVQQFQYPYVRSFTWRWETKRFIFKMIQDAAVGEGRYGTAILDFCGGGTKLQETAKKYDEISSQSRRSLFPGHTPDYISDLIKLAKEGKRVSSYEELMRILYPNK
jgi:nucleoside 2-deoxyribosyltransferase